MPKIQNLMNCIPIPILIFLFMSAMFIQNSASFAQSNILIGLKTEKELLESDHLFSVHTDRYNPDEAALQYLRTYDDSLTIQIFFGSWCRESKKYLPGLIKTLKLSAPEKATINYIGVNAGKNFPDSFLKKYNIKYIPTVVLLRGNKEVGRIEEAPSKLIEIELVEILKKEQKF